MSKPLAILVVENHEDTLIYLLQYLEQQGHIVHSSRSMRAALDALATHQIDVLISDIGLPDGDGWELLKQLDRKPFAIAMSGYGTDADCQKSIAAGYHHHLTKPFLPEDLDELLGSVQKNLALN